MQNGKDFMHVYARPPGAGRGSRSPPESPHQSPRSSGRYGRNKISRLPGPAGGGPSSKPYLFRLSALLLSYLLKRHAVLLLFPVIYISGMLLYMGTMSMDMSQVSSAPLPGSIYRSPQVFKHLWPVMESSVGGQMGSSFGVEKAWEYAGRAGWEPCPSRQQHLEGLPESNGYILIEANGGLNQQRSSHIWEIYDQRHYIDSLAGHVRIIERLPRVVFERFGNITNIYNFKIKKFATADFYFQKVLPKLQEAGAVRFSPFANRLSFDNIPTKVQQLRCQTNFEALRFAQPISSLADILVGRMIQESSNTDGKYIGVHLRFESDMVAFSCCIYDGGEKERMEMDAAREKGWRGKFTKAGRSIDPEANRRDGKCPLTPLEVGMILRGMGFSNTTPIYLAAGKIYKAQKTMAPLRKMFPYLHTKETLLSAEELAPLKKFSSRMAALDYTVCLHSEVFLTTQGGNFPQILIGHRRFLNKGHSKTIRPDKRKLALILDNPNITWYDFSRQMQAMRLHSDQKGHELRKPNASIYTYPAPDCMCAAKPVIDEIRGEDLKTISLL